jgi:hypothetical protein
VAASVEKLKELQKGGKWELPRSVPFTAQQSIYDRPSVPSKGTDPLSAVRTYNDVAPKLGVTGGV